MCCDDHENYIISIDVLDYPSVNVVHWLMFPSYCFHNLQSLDQMLYGPLKKYYNSMCDNWMFNHHQRTMLMHNTPQIVCDTFPKAMIPTNIQAEFKVT